jgi:transposase
MALDNRTIEFIRQLHFEEKLSINAIHKRTKLNRRTITKYVNAQDYKKNAQDTQFTEQYKKIREESNSKLLDMIKSNDYANITKTAMSLLTKKTLQDEIAKRGIRAVVGLISNSMDKTMALKRLEIDEEVKLRQDNSHDQLITEDNNFNKAVLEAILLLGDTDDLIDKESYVQAS